MRRPTSWLCVGALALTAPLAGCGETDGAASSAFAELTASAPALRRVADGAEDCARRVVTPRAVVVEDAPCEGVDLEAVSVAAVSDRLALAAVTRSGPGPGWVLEGSVRTAVERTPAERERRRTKVVVKKRKGPDRRVKRKVTVTVKVPRPPLRRVVHVRCTATTAALDVSDNHGPVRSLAPDGVLCRARGRAVEVTLPLAAFVVPGAARPADVGRVRLALARRLPDRSRVRDVLDGGFLRFRLDLAPCEREGREVRCPPWSSPSSSAP